MHREDRTLPPAEQHHTIAANRHQVPAPFRTFAVRSEEARHAWDARAPYGKVHVVPTHFLGESDLAKLSTVGYARVNLQAFSDVDYAQTTLPELAAVAPSAHDLADQIAAALQLTGVLGEDPLAYRNSVASRIDYLACCGAGFHNDVSRHWSACLFWILALDATEVSFVMPHAGVCIPVTPGDLLVFDPCMAHGLCRLGDGPQALATSFESSEHRHQLFLTGELLISDEQWAALGSPWLPVEAHDTAVALDLMMAEFDDCTGTIKRLSALREGMKRSTCHVDDMAA